MVRAVTCLCVAAYVSLIMPRALRAESQRYCDAIWIAAFSIAWSRQRDDVGHMFWVVVATDPTLGGPDAEKVRLALQPVTSADILRLAEDAYDMPRRTATNEQDLAVRDFADDARAVCLE